MTPEANAAGAAFTPKLNAFGNNLTRWDLTVEDVQVKAFKMKNMYMEIINLSNANLFIPIHL